MARFPSVDEQGQFEAPEVQDHIKELVTGSTDGITVDTSVGTRVFVGDVMVFYDSGWRDVTAEASATILSGRILIKRTTTEVYIVVDNVIIDGSGTNTLFRLPVGFRPAYRAQGYWNEDINRSNLGDYMLNTSGYVVFYNIPNDTTTPTRITVGIPASSTLPTSIPGTPA